MNNYYTFLLGVLCVWRITFLLSAEDGPGDALVSFRRMFGNGIWGKLLDCFYCLSLWIALPFGLWLADDWPKRAMLWLALSAGASITERITHPARSIPAALYMEDPKESHAMLRESEKPVNLDQAKPPTN